MSALCDAHKKKMGVELLYKSVQFGHQIIWRQGAEGALMVERRPVEKASTQQREPSGSRLSSLEIRPVGEKMLDWGTCPREAGPPGPGLSSTGERERNAVMANRVGANMLQFCSISNSLSHTTLWIKWEVYFFQNCVARLYFVVVMILLASAYEYTTPIHGNPTRIFILS